MVKQRELAKTQIKAGFDGCPYTDVHSTIKQCVQ